VPLPSCVRVPRNAWRVKRLTKGLTYQTHPTQPINDAYSTSDSAGDHEFHNLLAEPPPNPHRFILRGGGPLTKLSR